MDWFYLSREKKITISFLRFQASKVLLVLSFCLFMCLVLAGFILGLCQINDPRSYYVKNTTGKHLTDKLVYGHFRTVFTYIQKRISKTELTCAYNSMLESKLHYLERIASLLNMEMVILLISAFIIT